MRVFNPQSNELANVAFYGVPIPAMTFIESQIKIRKERVSERERKHDIPMIESVQDPPLRGPVPIGTKRKNPKYIENFALPAKLIMKLPPSDFAELISRPSKRKSQSRLFVYGPRIALFVTTNFYRALDQVFDIILVWENGNSDPDDPDGKEEEFNLIPSDTKGECKPTLIVRPDECKSRRLFEGDEHNLLEELKSDYRQQKRLDPRVYYYWLPLQHESNFPSDEHFLYAWDIEHCFTENLNKAANHAAECLQKHEGKMNFNIIVQLKKRTIDAGFLKHKSFRRFQKTIQRLDEYWGHVNGVHLSIEVV